MRNSLGLTNPTIVAALITAFIAAVGGIVGLFATYRLKVKEFRVTQIKARIDALEQAVLADLPDSSAENKADDQSPAPPAPIDNAIQGIMNAAWHRLSETEKL